MQVFCKFCDAIVPDLVSCVVCCPVVWHRLMKYRRHDGPVSPIDVLSLTFWPAVSIVKALQSSKSWISLLLGLPLL